MKRIKDVEGKAIEKRKDVQKRCTTENTEAKKYASVREEYVLPCSLFPLSN